MKVRSRAGWSGLAAGLVLAGTVAVAEPAKTAPQGIGTDDRLKLTLAPDERHLVLIEMRNFLQVVQTMTDALTREDMKTVAEAARSMGSGAANEIPPRTVAKLPNDFKMLAGSVHTQFDVIALDAESVGDSKHTLTQMSSLLQKCSACHSIYQVETKSFQRVKR